MTSLTYLLFTSAKHSFSIRSLLIPDFFGDELTTDSIAQWLLIVFTAHRIVRSEQQETDHTQGRGTNFIAIAAVGVERVLTRPRRSVIEQSAGISGLSRGQHLRGLVETIGNERRRIVALADTQQSPKDEHPNTPGQDLARENFTA
jgi:hypothetical protein